MEAAKGTTKEIAIRSIVKCSTCHGTGLKVGEKQRACRSCGGSGQRVFIRGGFQMATPCTTCGGTGSTIPESAKCTSCAGKGAVREMKKVIVKIPAGEIYTFPLFSSFFFLLFFFFLLDISNYKLFLNKIYIFECILLGVDNNTRIRLARQGDAAIGNPNAPPGDLYVTLRVTPHPKFVRDGSNINMTVHIPLQTALLGGYVRIPTLDGDVELKIPEGVQSGEKRVLRGRGTESVSGSRGKGDMVVEIKVDIPKSLTRRQRELLLEAFDLKPSSSTTSSSSSSSSTSSSKSSHPKSSFSTSTFTTSSKTSNPKETPSSTTSSSTSSSTASINSSNSESPKKGFFQTAFEKLKGKKD